MSGTSNFVTYYWLTESDIEILDAYLKTDEGANAYPQYESDFDYKSSIAEYANDLFAPLGDVDPDEWSFVDRFLKNNGGVGLRTAVFNLSSQPSELH